MTKHDSTEIQPAYLGPTTPDYPEVAQIARIYGDRLIGTNIYPAYIQQAITGPALRDREACYVWEPNGIKLGPGYYDCRLVSSYAGLPLLVTYCCVALSSSSSGG